MLLNITHLYSYNAYVCPLNHERFIEQMSNSEGKAPGHSDGAYGVMDKRHNSKSLYYLQVQKRKLR